MASCGKLTLAVVALWGLGCVVGAEVGDQIGVEASNTCPCRLQDAEDSLPGYGPGNLMWNCRNLFLAEVPTSCWNINSTHVTQVDLLNHHFQTLKPGDFDALVNLKYLNVYKGWLRSVEPGSLSPLSDTLEYLDIGFGYLTEIPEEVTTLSRLRSLALSYNQIKVVPRELIWPLRDTLEELFLVRNQVEEVPELDFLPHLTWLDLEANNVRSLPKRLLCNDLVLPCDLWINDNPISDVSATTLLALPDGSSIRTNASVVVWAADDEEAARMYDRDWRVYDKEQQNLDLFVMTKTCDEPHDTPVDFVHPCEAE